LCGHLLKSSKTRIIFTSREPLPPPYDKIGQTCILGRLSITDAIQLVHEAMKEAQLMPKEMPDGSPDPDVERLVESVNSHARSLVLLAPHIEKLGVDQTGDVLGQLMAELHEKYPDDRERSLYASVELSLRRLPEDIRRVVDILAVFNDGVNEGVWSQMKQTDSQSNGISFPRLQTALCSIGLAQAYPHGHMRLHPALSSYLKTQVSDNFFASAQKKWAQGTKLLVNFLYEQYFKNTHFSAELTLLELPNLIALLDYTNQREHTEEILDLAVCIENLLKRLDCRQIFQQVASIQEKAAKKLEKLNLIHFNSEMNKIERLLGQGNIDTAKIAAEDLLNKTLAAGKTASAYNIAMANKLLGNVLKKSGDSEHALSYFETARKQFKRIGKDGERMASVILTDEGDCLRNLGRFDEASTAYEKCIDLVEKLGDHRQTAVLKGQLGTLRYYQKRYEEALIAYKSAMNFFDKQGDLDSIAILWHQMGIVHGDSNNFSEAEIAYKKSLAIKVLRNNKDGESSSLFQLGNLFNQMEKYEDAVTFYQQAANIHVEQGNKAKECLNRNNLADTFIKLKRYDDARQEIERAIECHKSFGHSTVSTVPWVSWNYLFTIENALGNFTEAKTARDQAVNLYMDFRQSGGGKYEYGAQLCDIVEGAIQSGERVMVEAAFGKFGGDFLPLIEVLRQILDGVRGVQVLEGLSYMHEVDVRLLLKRLGI